jgi:PAS domain S-box-containing protein
LQSEERYRNVVEDQTEFICRFSPKGNLTFVNDAYCRYFGLDKDSCIGLPHTVRIPPEDRGLMQQHLSVLTPHHPVAIIEHRIVMPSGEIRWQRWNDRAIYDRDGTIIEFQSVGRDTTDRMVADEKLKRTNEELAAAYEQMTAVDEELRANFEELSKSQQALQQSEERYRNVVEDQTEFICRFRPDGTHHFVNDAYCRYFGLSREDILNNRFVPQMPEEDQEIVRSHFRSLTQENPVGWVVHRIIMPDGSVRWHRWNDRAIFDRNGSVTEYLSVGRDITEQKTIELELLRKNEELMIVAAEFNDLYNRAPCGYHSLAPDGLITRINDTELSWLGRSRYDVVGSKTFSDLLTEGSRDIFRQDFTTLIDGGTARGGEVEIVRNDGTVLPVLYSITAERDPAGTIIAANMTLFDNSEQKAAELSIQKANEKLNMLSMITRHDILNQLTGLRAFLELSRPMVHEGQALAYLDRVDEAADVIGRQIEFTRYYQNIGIQSPDWRDLAKTIRNSAAQAPLEKIAFRNVAPGLEVYADPLIERVFYNLIDNSLRHGQFVSSIAITAEETDNGVLITYKDDGIGITAEDKAKLFRKGFGKHSGLGLFLSREILAITSITITEAGEPDNGVQFEIVVPKGKYRFSAPAPAA